MSQNNQIFGSPSIIRQNKPAAYVSSLKIYQNPHSKSNTHQGAASQQNISSHRAITQNITQNINMHTSSPKNPIKTNQIKSSIKQEMFPQSQTVAKPTRDSSAQNRSKSILSNKSSKKQISMKENQNYEASSFTLQSRKTNQKIAKQESKSELYSQKQQFRYPNQVNQQYSGFRQQGNDAYQKSNYLGTPAANQYNNNPRPGQFYQQRNQQIGRQSFNSYKKSFFANLANDNKSTMNRQNQIKDRISLQLQSPLNREQHSISNEQSNHNRPVSQNLMIQRQIDEQNERQEQYEIQRQSNIVYNSQMRSLGKIFGDQNMEFQKIKQNIENVILNSGVQMTSQKSRQQKSKQKLNQSRPQQNVSLRVEKDIKNENSKLTQNRVSGQFGIKGNIIDQSSPDQNVRRSNIKSSYHQDYNNKCTPNHHSSNLQLSIRLVERLKTVQDELSKRREAQNEFTTYKSIGISNNFNRFPTQRQQETLKNQQKSSQFKYQKQQQSQLHNQHYVHYEQHGFSSYIHSKNTIGSNLQKTSQKDSISKIQIQNPSQSLLQSQKQQIHNNEPSYNIIMPSSQRNIQTSYVNQSNQSHKLQTQNKQSKQIIKLKTSVSQNQLSLSQRINQYNPKNFKSTEQAVVTILGIDHPILKSIHHYNEYQQNTFNQNQISYTKDSKKVQNLYKKHHQFFDYYANSNNNRNSQHQNSQTSKNHIKSPKNSINSERGQIIIHPLAVQNSFKKQGVNRSVDINFNLAQQRMQLEQTLKNKNSVIQQLTKQLNAERLKSQKSIQLEKALKQFNEQSLQKIKVSQNLKPAQSSLQYAGKRFTPEQLIKIVKQKDDQIADKLSRAASQSQEILSLKQKLLNIEQQYQNKAILKSVAQQKIVNTIKNVNQSFFKQQCLKLETQLQFHKQTLETEIRKNQEISKKLMQIQKYVKNHEENMYTRQKQLNQRHQKEIELMNQKLTQQENRVKLTQNSEKKYKDEIHQLQQKMKELQQNQIRYRNVESFIKTEVQNRFAEQIKNLHLQITDLKRLNQQRCNQQAQNTINLQEKDFQINILRRKQQTIQEQLRQVRQKHRLAQQQKQNLLEQASKAGDSTRHWVQKYNRLDAQLTNFKGQNSRIKERLEQLDREYSDYRNMFSPIAHQQLNTKVFSLNEIISTRGQQMIQYKKQLQREKQLRLQIDRQYQQKIKAQRQQKIRLERAYQQLKFELSKQSQSYKKIELQYSTFKEDYHKVAVEYENINSSYSIITQQLNFKKRGYFQLESDLQRSRNQIHNLKTLLKQRQNQNDLAKTQVRNKTQQQVKLRAQYQRQVFQLQEKMRQNQLNLQRRQNDFERVKQEFEKYRHRTQQLEMQKEKVKGSFDRKIQQKDTTYQQLLERAEQEKTIALNEQKSQAQYYKKMYEQINNRAKQLENSINRLKTQKIPILQKEHAQMVDQKIKSQRSINNFQEVIRDLQEQLRRVKQQRIPSLQKTCQDYVFKAGTFQMKYRSLQTKNNELQEDLKYKNQSLIPQLRHQIQERKDRYFKLYDQMSQYRQQVQQLTSKLRQKQIDYEQLKRLFEDKNSQLQEINQLRQQISINFYELQSKFEQKQQNINEISRKYHQYEYENKYLKQSKESNEKKFEQIEQQMKSYRINLYEMEQQTKKKQMEFDAFKDGMTQLFRNYDEVQKMQVSSEIKLKARQTLARQLSQFLQVDLVRILLPVYSSNLKMQLSNSESRHSKQSNIQEQDQNKKSEFYKQLKQRQKIDYQNKNSNTSFARGDHQQNRNMKDSNNVSNINYIQGKIHEVPYNATIDQKQRVFQRPLSSKSIKQKKQQSNKIDIKKQQHQQQGQQQHQYWQQRNMNNPNMLRSTNRDSLNYQHFYQIGPVSNPIVPIKNEIVFSRVKSDQQFSFKKQPIPMISSITPENQRNSLEHNIYHPNFTQSKTNGFPRMGSNQFRKTHGSVQSVHSHDSRNNSLNRKQKIELINPPLPQQNKMNRFTGIINMAQVQTLNNNIRNPSRISRQANFQHNSIQKSQGSRNSSQEAHPYYVSTDPRVSRKEKNRFTGVIDNKSNNFVPNSKQQLDMLQISNNLNRNVVFNRASGTSLASSSQPKKLQNNIYSGTIPMNSAVPRNSHQTINSNAIQQVSQSQPSQILGSVTDSQDSGIHIFQRQNKGGGCCFGKQ